MADDETLRSVIREAIVERLGPAAQVSDVSVKADADFGGEDVLYVRAIYDGGFDSVAADKVVGLIRHVRGRLRDELGDHRFPVISLVAREEIEPAAA